MFTNHIILQCDCDAAVGQILIIARAQAHSTLEKKTTTNDKLITEIILYSLAFLRAPTLYNIYHYLMDQTFCSHV